MKVASFLRTFAVFLLFFNSPNLLAKSQVGKNQQSPTCEFTFLVKNVITQNGDIVSGINDSNSVYLQLPGEILKVNFRGKQSEIQVIKGQIDQNQSPGNNPIRGTEAYFEDDRLPMEFKLETTRDRDTPVRKVRFIGWVSLISHPTRGMFAVDLSGVVLRVPPALAILNSDEMSSFPYETPFDGEHILVTRRSDKTVYLLHLDFSQEDYWPGLRAFDYATYVDPFPNHSNEKEPFVNLDEFSLIEQFFQWEELKSPGRPTYTGFDLNRGVEFKMYGADSPISGTTKDHEHTLTKIEYNGKPMFVFTHSQGFAVYDPETKKVIDKPFSLDVAIPLNFQVQALFDLPYLNKIMVITASNHIRLIDLDKLFESDQDEVITFDRMQPGKINSDQFGVGIVLKYTVEKNIVKIWSTDGNDRGLNPSNGRRSRRSDSLSRTIYYTEIEVNPEGEDRVLKREESKLYSPFRSRLGPDDFY